MTLTFTTTGQRRRPDSGIYYTSECGRYAIYHSDQVMGLPVAEPIWLAVDYTRYPCGRVIGRKRSRNGAIRACVRHCRATRGQRAESVTKPARRAKRAPRAHQQRVPTSVGPAKQATLF